MSDDTTKTPDLDGELAVEERKKTKRPRMYQVVLHNDDYTTMEFVVYILMEIFNKTNTEATQVMLHVHTKGKGICGLYTREIAETKVQQVMEAAQEFGHPLRCTMDPEDDLPD
ncbi:MAG: ATP-dependent Clp protease adapter ClpS [Deltaproteobacteria bacterium]|nr:ATP-dependent Clp protease adapter ClpS [Deltaproteobacteria bacterium]